MGPADADDVVQESLQRAWRKWSLFDRERGSPRTWLLAITAHEAHRWTRRGARRALAEGTVKLGGATLVDSDGDLDLRTAVARLPRRQRLAITLIYYVGLSVAEAAAVMGVSAGTVKSTVFVARKRLRGEVGDS